MSERFGERSLLPISAKDANGETFHKLTVGMNPSQKSDVQSAWNSMRTVQQLAAHERTTLALKQAETARQTQTKGIALK